MKVVISDPKTGKAYSKKLEEPDYFFNKKIGDTVSLGFMGLNDFEAQITGGSDSDGVPMKKNLLGTMRNKNFVTINKKHGIRQRITQRGNTVAKDISQLNIKITKNGSKKIEEILVPEKKDEKKSAKEELVEASLKTAGTKQAAKEMEMAEFKKGESKKKVNKND